MKRVPTHRTTLSPGWETPPERDRRSKAMGLAWQQGPLAEVAIGRFLVPDPLPARLLYAEGRGRRMRVRRGDTWIADREDGVLLHEPGRYPVAYSPLGYIPDGALKDTQRTTSHRDLGA